MTDLITKGNIFKDDMAIYDGGSATGTRKTSTGGTQILQKIDWVGVDVYQLQGARTSTAINNSLITIGSIRTNMFLGPGAWTLSANVTIPSNVHLVIPEGSTVNGAYTLTISGGLTAHPSCFGNTVTVAGLKYADVSWWGPDGTADDSEIQRAHDALGSTRGILHFAPATYTIDNDLDFSASKTIIFEFEEGAIFARNSGDEVVTFYSPSNIRASTRQKLTAADMIAFSLGGDIWVDWWGAVADDSTDNVNAIQYCLNTAYDCEAQVRFNGGIYQTSTVDYHGQSMRGQAACSSIFPDYLNTSHTTIKGLASQDVFFFGDISSISKAYIQGGNVRDLMIIVNDSVDASASFTNRSRYGVGNAGFACEWSDGETVPYAAWNVIHCRWENVTIASASLTAQNKSCGFFTQGMTYQSIFDGLKISRLEFGWFMDYPVSNVTLVDFYSDVNSWRDCSFDYCVEPFQHYNGEYNQMVNCVIACGTDDHYSLRIRSVQSLVRDGALNWTIDQLYSEGGETDEVEHMTITGRYHTIINSYLIAGSTTQGYISWSADHCKVISPKIYITGGTTAILRITGDYNVFEKVDFGSVVYDPWTEYNPVSDTGLGNHVSGDRINNTTDLKSRDLAFNIFRDGIVGSRTGDFLRSVPSTPFSSHEDLFFWPNEMVWNVYGSAATLTKDMTMAAGQYATVPTPGGFYVSLFSQRYVRVGYELPKAHMMLAIMLKNGTSNTTQDINIYLNGGAGTLIGSDTLSTTTSWAVYFVPFDCTAGSDEDYLFISLNNPTANQAVNVGFIGLIPVPAWILGAERSADPVAPIEGQFVIWMSDGTGKGDDGDILIASTAGGATKYTTLFDHSAGSAW